MCTCVILIGVRVHVLLMGVGVHVILMCVYVHVILMSVSVPQVYEMLDLDPASWATLVAQWVRVSVQLILILFNASSACLSFFLSFFLS